MSTRRRLSRTFKLWVFLTHWMKGGDPSSFMKFWTSQDGRQTRICYLENGHLCNILRLLVRKHVERMMCAPMPQGEYAQLAYEQETAAETFWDFVPRHPLWQDLVNEAILREITW